MVRRQQHSGGTLTINDSTLSHGAASAGGGIYVQTASTTTITGSPISDNTSVHQGAGIYLDGGSDSVTIINSTRLISSETSHTGVQDSENYEIQVPNPLDAP